MKKLMNLFFAMVMMFSIVFIGSAISSNGNLSVQAQTVKVKKKKVGAIRYIGRGSKYVAKQVWNGTRWVGVRTWRGTKYIGKKTWKGTKYVGGKVKRAIY